MRAILIDTNVLVYAYDRGEIHKQARAIDTLAYIHQARAGRLSVQSLAEFFTVVTRGKRQILTAEIAAREIERLAASWPVLDLTPHVVLEALRGAQEHHMPYWDAQLWATAKLNQVPVLFSEDFNSGATIEGVRFVNPFADGFAVEQWA